MEIPFDAILLVSFGGPESNDDVIPFLENVLRGRNVPKNRMEEVAQHYYEFGGISPINAHCRELIKALRQELDAASIDLPIYWGNRNWHPMLSDTVKQMSEQGVRRALAFVTSAYSSYSSCRQYLEDIEKARAALNSNGTEAPLIEKLRPFYNHPHFIEVNAQNIREALKQLPSDGEDETQIVFTAHSIPLSMANGCQYSTQLMDASRMVAEKTSIGNWSLAYQSRSGPPTQPWLAPDICDHLRSIALTGCKNVVVCPIGFISDHMEVIYDLDHQAKEVAAQVGLNMARAATAGVHPLFVEMIRLLIEERTKSAPRLVAGNTSALPDVCPVDCCQKG